MSNKTANISFFRPIAQSPANKTHGEKGAFLGRCINIFDFSGKKAYQFVGTGQVSTVRRNKKPSAGKAVLKVVLLMTGIVPLLAIVFRAIYQRMNTLKKISILPPPGRALTRAASHTNLRSLTTDDSTTTKLPRRERAGSLSDIASVVVDFMSTKPPAKETDTATDAVDPEPTVISTDGQSDDKRATRPARARLTVVPQPTSFASPEEQSTDGVHPLNGPRQPEPVVGLTAMAQLAASSDDSEPSPASSLPPTAVGSSSSSQTPAASVGETPSETFALPADYLGGKFRDLLQAAKTQMDILGIIEPASRVAYSAILAEIPSSAGSTRTVPPFETLNAAVTAHYEELSKRFEGDECSLKKVSLYIELYRPLWESTKETSFVPSVQCGHDFNVHVIDGKVYIQSNNPLPKQPGDGREYVYGYDYTGKTFIAIAKHLIPAPKTNLFGGDNSLEVATAKAKGMGFMTNPRANTFNTNYHIANNGNVIQIQLIRFPQSAK